MQTTIFKTILLISVFFLSFQMKAQDTIIKKNGDKLEVIIKEVTDNEIKYFEINDTNKVLFTIDKALVKEVKFNYGKEIIVQNKEENTDYFIDDKKNNIMLNFLAIGNNTLALAYERSLKPGHSFMAEVKVYGAGIPNEDYTRSGAGLDLAYRLKLRSLFRKKGYRPRHVLSGSYFSPVLGFSNGERTKTNNYSNYEATHSLLHFGLQFGKQIILQNTISIDGSVGFHYYVGSYNDKYTQSNEDYYYESYEPVRLGNMIGSDNKLLSFNLRIGFLAGK